MMTELKKAWLARSLRERQLITAALVLVIIVFMASFMRSVSANIESLETRLPSLRAQLAQLREIEHRLPAASVQPVSGDIKATVRKLLNKTGLGDQPIKQGRGQPGKVVLEMKTVKNASLHRFLIAARSSGLKLSNIKIKWSKKDRSVDARIELSS